MAVRTCTAAAFDRNMMPRINATHTLTSAFLVHVESICCFAPNILNIEPVGLA
jgi:hypothetical protein